MEKQGYDDMIRHIEGKNLLNLSQLGFRTNHSTVIQCVRLKDHVTLNFNNNMSTPAVFLDIEEAFDILWHPGLLYKLSTMDFSPNLIRLNSSFLSQRKFSVSMQGEMSMLRYINAGVSQGSGLSATIYNLYMKHILKTAVVNLALFADDSSLYVTERKEGYVLTKIPAWTKFNNSLVKQWNM
jgi:hypothetical protein